MAKMEMPVEAETKDDAAMPGDSFSEQIAKLMPKEKELISKLVDALVK